MSTTTTGWWLGQALPRPTHALADPTAVPDVAALRRRQPGSGRDPLSPSPLSLLPPVFTPCFSVRPGADHEPAPGQPPRWIPT
ncbi:hypothetical protein ACW9KT_20455 [Hymenobacter sp. HD11105]